MNTEVYDDIRYGHYNTFYLDQYGGDLLTPLLPRKYKHVELTKNNSMLVNPLNQNFVGFIKSGSFNICDIINDLNKIDYGYDNYIFQIVGLNGVNYINPYFKQPNKLLIKEFLTSGRFSSTEKEILGRINEMQQKCSVTIPNYETICVVKKSEPITKIMSKCISLNNPIYLIDDYVKIIKKSPFWLYIQKD